MQRQEHVLMWFLVPRESVTWRLRKSDPADPAGSLIIKSTGIFFNYEH